MRLIFITTIILLHYSYSSKGQSNPWSSRVEQTLPTYVPLPINEIAEAGRILEAREAAKNRATIKAYREFYAATENFKAATNGHHNVVLILNGKEIGQGRVFVMDNRIQTLFLGKNRFASSTGLRITSEIKDAYNKLFLEYDSRLTPIEVYFTNLFL